MRCSACKFWVKSQAYGNHCTCMGMRPCDRDRRDKRSEHRKKHNKRNRKYNNNNDNELI